MIVHAEAFASIREGVVGVTGRGQHHHVPWSGPQEQGQPRERPHRPGDFTFHLPLPLPFSDPSWWKGGGLLAVDDARFALNLGL